MAKVVQLIETHERVGLGKEGDPCRLVYQLWTFDGVLVFERDDWLEQQKEKDICQSG